jgi:hypothetical protein
MVADFSQAKFNALFSVVRTEKYCVRFVKKSLKVVSMRNKRDREAGYRCKLVSDRGDRCMFIY